MPPIDTTYYPDGTALHLWQVTEDITALMECCKNLGITPPNTMNCTKRMKEKLIEALLLHHIFGKIVTLGHTQSGAPTIDIDRCHISISHTSGWIAIAKNYNHNIGIDIERCSSRILRVREKFLNTQELAFIAHDDIIENTLAWTAKEALYKLFEGCGGASLSDRYAIDKSRLHNNGYITHSAKAAISPNEQLCIMSQIIPDAVISLAVAAKYL